MSKSLFLTIIMFCFFSAEGRSIEAVAGGEQSICQEFRLNRELKVYKDPSLFIGLLGQMYNDPQLGWQNLLAENPILTVLEGTVYLMKLGEPIEFKNFGVISKIYELAEPKLKIKPDLEKAGPSQKTPPIRPWVIPMRICGPVYKDSLGFVLVSDLERALRDDFSYEGLPPSVYPNPIPKLKKD